MPLSQSCNGSLIPSLSSDRLTADDLVSRFIAVYWPDELLYPALVRRYNRRQHVYELDYVDGDREFINLDTTAWVILPDNLSSVCKQCAIQIDLRSVYTLDSGYLVCCACTHVYHISCLFQNGTTLRSVMDATKWMCFACNRRAGTATNSAEFISHRPCGTEERVSRIDMDNAALKAAILPRSVSDNLSWNAIDKAVEQQPSGVIERRIVTGDAPNGDAPNGDAPNSHAAQATQSGSGLSAFDDDGIAVQLTCKADVREPCGQFRLSADPSKIVAWTSRDAQWAVDVTRTKFPRGGIYPFPNFGIISAPKTDAFRSLHEDQVLRFPTGSLSRIHATNVLEANYDLWNAVIPPVATSKYASSLAMQNRTMERAGRHDCIGSISRVFAQQGFEPCHALSASVNTVDYSSSANFLSTLHNSAALHDFPCVEIAQDTSMPSSEQVGSIAVYSAKEIVGFADKHRVDSASLCDKNGGFRARPMHSSEPSDSEFSPLSTADGCALQSCLCDDENMNASARPAIRKEGILNWEKSECSDAEIQQFMKRGSKHAPESKTHTSEFEKGMRCKKRMRYSTDGAHCVSENRLSESAIPSHAMSEDLGSHDADRGRKRMTVNRRKSKTVGRQATQIVRLNTVPYERLGRSERICAFCGLQGALPECEGPLLGPFSVNKLKVTLSIYAHRNCVTWSPEVFEGAEEGQLLGVKDAFVRARRMKCIVCGGFGASLSCMFRMTACCKPMHFRCALLGGAVLFAFSNSFQTLCPKHAQCSIEADDKPLPLEMRHVQTPLPVEYFSADSLCHVCGRENFNPALGALLECCSCSKKMHSKCSIPSVLCDGAFAVESAENKFRCVECRQCAVCFRPPVARTSRGAGVKVCVGCSLIFVHSSCAGKGRTSLYLSADKSVMRCELCRVCRHCGMYRVPRNEWDEGLHSCETCSRRYRRGFFCPVCDKVYPESEDCDMIQCDGCDKWIHVDECCGLSDDQYRELRESDAKFTCSTCDEKCKPSRRKSRERKGRTSVVKPGRKRIVPARRQEEVDESTSEHVETADDESAVGGSVDDVDLTDVLECDMVLWVNASRASLSESSVFCGDFASEIDLCRCCGCAGDVKSFRYCSSCGDCYHNYCLTFPLPELVALDDVSSASAGTCRRLGGGSLDPRGPYWHCPNCRACAFCGLHETESTSSSRSLYRCNRCHIYFHRTCLPGIVSDKSVLIDGINFTTCTDCHLCEVCGATTDSFAVFRDRVLCHSCAPHVQNARPCSICMVPFPIASRKQNTAPHSNAECFSEQELSPANCWAPVVRICINCKSAVHTACEDPERKISQRSYTCSTCLSLPVNGSKKKWSETRMDRILSNSSVDLKHSRNAFESYCISSSTKKSNSEESSTSNDLLPVSCSDEALAPKGRCAVSLDDDLPSCTSDRHERHDVDLRKCEFCEGFEDHGSMEGRLIPWPADFGSSGHSTSIWWVHATCAILSSGVSHRCAFQKGRRPQCILVASRRDMAVLVRSSKCVLCHKMGATIMCSAADCSSKYHYGCAVTAGCTIQAKSKLSSKRTERSINLAHISFFDIRCPCHAVDTSNTSTEAEDCCTDMMAIGPGCCIDLNCSIRFHSTSSKTERVTSLSRRRLRIGALMVAQFGRLVPSSSLFVDSSTLIPTEYIAARRHWSLRYPGKRCTYLLKTSGTSRSGPWFAITSSDDPDLRVGAATADAAWYKVVAAMEIMRLRKQPNMSNLNYTVCTVGGDVFGLSNRDKTVSMIEQLPLASLLQGRYEFRHVTPPPIKDLSFPLPRLNHMTPANLSGSVRTEGYVPFRKNFTDASCSYPTYKNVLSGEKFQLQVAIGSGRETLEEGPSESTQSIGTVSHPAKGKGRNITSEDANRTSCNFAFSHLSHSMQHRAMLGTWQRRTVILRSRIDGWGVFATEDIMPNEMVIEYSGELIRPVLSDWREAQYDRQGIGCYMFEVEPGVIVDATRVGNRARFINHSCDPNCFSRVVSIDNSRRVIVIFSKRYIRRGEELCYDYQFPLDENDRVICACGSSRCKGFMN